MLESERIQNLYNQNIEQVKQTAKNQSVIAYNKIVKDLENAAKDGVKSVDVDLSDGNIYLLMELKEKLMKEGFIVGNVNRVSGSKKFKVKF
jgi:hypothetical protein